MKPVPERRVCSFCEDNEDTGVPLFWKHPVRGPWICSRCVWQAVAELQRDMEDTRAEVYVSNSPIHGRGVFSGERISKGAYVGTYEGIDNGPVTHHNEPFVIYYDQGEMLGWEGGWRIGTNEFRFLNHSDTPNIEMDEDFHFWAARQIKENEELTWYYGDEFSGFLKSNSKKRHR